MQVFEIKRRRKRERKIHIQIRNLYTRRKCNERKRIRGYGVWRENMNNKWPIDIFVRRQEIIGARNRTVEERRDLCGDGF
jgi:hypothetical protein